MPPRQSWSCLKTRPPRDIILRQMAGVAQLVEHRTVDAAVAGSSPVARPTKKTGPGTGF